MTKDAGWFAYGSAATCPVCGSDPVKIIRPNVALRLGRWLRDGGPVSKGESTCANGHAWSASSSGYNQRLRRSHWFRIISFNRRITPTPVTYVMAFAVGTLAGALLNKIVGIPFWWLGGFLLALFAFLASMRTAFGGPQGDRTRQQLQDLRDPTGALARRHSRQHNLITSRQFPIYGLVEPLGVTSHAGMSSRSDSGLTSYAVRYDDANSGLSIEIETKLLDARDRQRGTSAGVDHSAAHNFVHWLATDPVPAADAYTFANDATWTPTTITIEGHTHPATTTHHGTASLTTATLNHLHLTIMSTHDIAHLNLTEITPPTNQR